VASVDTTGYWRDGSISPTSTGYHYNHNAETFLLVGDALGRAMIELDAAFAVNAGADMVTWSGEPVDLSATVQAGVVVDSYLWTAVTPDPNATIVFDANDIATPEITITKIDAEATMVTVKLTVDDGVNAPVSDTMEIEVYDNNCQAARIGKELADAYQADFVNEDCLIGLDELAAIAEKWLDVKGLTAPQHR